MTSEQLSDNPEFSALAARVSRMEFDLRQNTIATRQIEENTASIVDAFHTAQGAFRALEFIGKVAKVLVPIVIVLGAWKTGFVEFVTDGVKFIKDLWG